MTYMPTELRLHINDYVGSSIIGEQRAQTTDEWKRHYDEIKKLYPNFSLSYLYIRYWDWKERLDENIDEDIIETYELLSKIRFKLAYNHEYSTGSVRISDPKDIKCFKTIRSEDSTYDNIEKTHLEYALEGSDEILTMLSYFILLDLKPYNENVIQVNTVLRGTKYRYVHSKEPKVREDRFDRYYLDEIHKLDPNFSIQHLYSILSKKHLRASELNSYPIDHWTRYIIVDHVNELSILGNKIIMDMSCEVLEWEDYKISKTVYVLDGTYDMFVSIVASLEHGNNQNNTYEPNELYEYYSYITNPY
jgi:hypothetical protein